MTQSAMPRIQHDSTCDFYRTVTSLCSVLIFLLLIQLEFLWASLLPNGREGRWGGGGGTESIVGPLYKQISHCFSLPAHKTLSD